MKASCFLVLFLTLTSFVFSGRSGRVDQDGEVPFAGTILEYSSENQLPGQTSLQFIYFAGASYGEYANDWSMQAEEHYAAFGYQIFGYVGITKHFQFEFGLNAGTIRYKGKSTTHFGDTQAGLGFQFMWQERDTPKPNLRLVIFETFPTGKYEKLNPYFRGNDAQGFGSYITSTTLVVQKTLFTIPNHPWNFNASLSYNYFHKTNIQGFSRYSETRLTDGTMYPGDSIYATFSNEYHFFTKGNFTFNFAIDWTYLHTFRGNFHGNAGILPSGEPGEILTESQDIFSVLPALEFVFGEHAGFAFYIGVYLSLLGRNTGSFAQGVFSLVGTF